MASSMKTKNRLSVILSCAICFEEKHGKFPKVLNCFHSFCRTCLESWMTKQNYGTREIQCPLCQRWTKLPLEGVSGLPIDENIESLEKQVFFDDTLECQACQTKGSPELAKAKCLSCDIRLCEDCYRKHASCDDSKKHEVVTELCELHGNPVTHVCVTCMLGLCSSCVSSIFHQKHELCQKEEGLNKLESFVNKEIMDFKMACDKANVKVDTMKEKQEDLVIENETLLISAAVAMKNEIHDLVTSTISRYRSSFKGELAKWLRGRKDDLQSIIQKEATGEGRKEVVCGRVSEMSLRIAGFRKTINSLEELDLRRTAIPESLISLELFKSKAASDVLPTELYNNYKAVLVIDPEDKPSLLWNKGTADPVGIEVLDDFSAVVAFEGSDHVLRYDTKGRVMGGYHCAGRLNANKVQRITTSEGYLHILCKDNQTIISIELNTYERRVRKFKELDGDLYSFSYDPSNGSFFISQNGLDGYLVHKCCPRNMALETFLEDGGSAVVIRNAGTYKTVVTRYVFCDVQVFSSEGNLLYTIKYGEEGNLFSVPVEAAHFLHGNVLLVADIGNHNISMFDLNNKGAFIGDLLSQEDGIPEPFHISCKYPYLWVGGKGRLALYKWS